MLKKKKWRETLPIYLERIVFSMESTDIGIIMLGATILPQGIKTPAYKFPLCNLLSLVVGMNEASLVE